MWAGSRIEFLVPLRLGQQVRRESVVVDITSKSGRSGELVFVTLKHEIYAQEILCLVEEQDLVYREPASGSQGSAQPGSGAAHESADWRRLVQPDPVLLFRYSALTFNSHRIHYDRPYATDVEGYGGLVVQGPLTATLLLHQLAQQYEGAAVQSFQFRGLTPLLDNAPLYLCGSREGAVVSLWALNGEGGVAMEARATLAQA
jgi:3-methylfumaryl-CoA hydratase